MQAVSFDGCKEQCSAASKQKSLDQSHTRHKGYIAQSHFTAGNGKGKVLVVVGTAGSKHRNIFPS